MLKIDLVEDILTRLNIPYLLSRWDNILPLTALIVLYVIALVAVGHILLIKRDPRAALGWIVVCLGFPGAGVLFYVLFGINRIRTRAKDWQERDLWGLTAGQKRREKVIVEVGEKQNFDYGTFRSLIHVSNTVTRRPIMKGCCFEAYHNAEEAYPAMIDAIEKAEKSVYLCTYIYENNQSGCEFADAMARAVKRGVDVRVIVDAVGLWYSLPTAFHMLKKRGLNVVKFLPLSISKRSIHFNLRNHRKILVVDRKIGFTGGMNIGDSHYVTKGKPKSRVADIQFKVEGPVVSQLEEAFFEDWYFVTGERPPEPIVPINTKRGEALARGITAGPNEGFEKLRWIVNAAFGCAKKHIRIMTPYFVPDTAMLTAIIAARLKGVEIEIILPHVNNLPYVGWASQAYLEEFLRYDVKLWYRKTPFAHSKVLIVDDFYVLLGSANLDTRSLRLNFEFNMEAYDRGLAEKMITHFNDVKSHVIPITLERMTKRPLVVKLRDALAKLFSPYL